MTTIIAKNPSGADIIISDMGKVILAGSDSDLTDSFDLSEIIDSKDLYNLVNTGQLIINDGTEDLSISDGLLHITLQTELEDLEQDGSIAFDRNVDGGRADSVYLPVQNFDGGDANG